MSNFPFQIFSKYDSNPNEESQSAFHRDTESSSSASSLDSKVNRIAQNIADVVIRSAGNNDDQKSIHLNIPKEVLLFSSIIISKVLLFSAYKAAKEYGLEILDL